MSTDYYKILGIEKTASPDEIKKAYRKLALLWHPDKHAGDSEKDKKIAEEKFKNISKAYEILSDDKKRQTYDQYGDEAVNIPDGEQSHFGGGFGGDPRDIFNAFFGGENPFETHISDDGTHRVHINFGNMRGFKNMNNMHGMHSMHSMHNDSDEDLYSGKKDPSNTVNLMLSLEDLYNGIKKKIKITRKKQTKSKIIQEHEILELEIKPGMKDGTKITFNNKGDHYIGREPGDIIFVIKQKPHDIFERHDGNLITKIDISNKDIETGFEKKIKDITGVYHTIKINNNEIKDSLFEYKINKKGMPIRKEGKIIGHGDMIVRFNIKFS
jgi:DnaJ family protein B protein 4